MYIEKIEIEVNKWRIHSKVTLCKMDRLILLDQNKSSGINVRLYVSVIWIIIRYIKSMYRMYPLEMHSKMFPFYIWKFLCDMIVSSRIEKWKLDSTDARRL